MQHTDQKRMLNDLYDNQDGLIVESPSRHVALYVPPKGDALLLEGDFTGSPEELEKQIQRLTSQMQSPN